MGILPPLPTNPARSREGDNGLFSSISSSFRPIVGWSGAGGVALARRSSLFIAILWRGRSAEPGSCSLLRKQKGEEREWTARPIAVVGRSTCDIDFGGTNIVFGQCVSRTSRLRTVHFHSVIEVLKLLPRSLPSTLHCKH